MADDGLFRKAALDKLASPERLDVLMEVTPSKDRIAKLTIAALIVAGIAWAVLGTMPDRIPGRGQTRGGAGLQQIRATGEGILEGFALSEGDHVNADQQIAQIQSVSAEQNTQALVTAAQEADLRASAVRAEVGGEIARLQARRGDAAARLADKQRERPTIAKQVADGDRPAKDLAAVDAQINQMQSEITQIDLQISSTNQRVRDADLSARQAHIALDSATQKTAASVEVRTTVAGNITQVLKKRGDRVTRGDVLAEIEVQAETDRLDIVAYVPASFGRNSLKAGQPVQVTVDGIKREQYGFLKGTVRHVSEVIVSGQTVSDVTKESSGGASYEILVTPVSDPATVSGYAWSTGKGPPLKVDGGSGVTIAVEVGERHPIALLLPYLRGLIGL